MLERIEKVLDEKVRPALKNHDGDIKVVRVEDGVLYFRMLGQCSNCPSAVVTAEELWQDAMELLRRRHNGEA